MKYLSDRYNRGHVRVEEYMLEAQRYIPTKELADSLPDILQAIQNPQRPATCLVAFQIAPRPETEACDPHH